VVQDFIRAAAGVTAMADLRALIEEAAWALNFNYFAIVHHVRFGQPTDGQVRLSNYPLEWLALVREQRKLADPVLRAAERAPSGFKWEELPALLELTSAEQSHLERAAKLEIEQGFTVPNHVPGETFGSCHFVVKGRGAFPDAHIPAAQALGAFAFEAARRLLAEHGEPSGNYLPTVPLSDRQRECLIFVARGKSDSVIGQILNIKPKTVNEHVEAAKRRYAVSTRSQLVVRALFKSEICFSEALA
jgi:LuxR family quorum-sensing system transcriptional regulator CciR